jgi:hypothetical protein
MTFSCLFQSVRWDLLVLGKWCVKDLNVDLQYFPHLFSLSSNDDGACVELVLFWCLSLPTQTYCTLCQHLPGKELKTHKWVLSQLLQSTSHPLNLFPENIVSFRLFAFKGFPLKYCSVWCLPEPMCLSSLQQPAVQAEVHKQFLCNILLSPPTSCLYEPIFFYSVNIFVLVSREITWHSSLKSFGKHILLKWYVSMTPSILFTHTK